MNKKLMVVAGAAGLLLGGAVHAADIGVGVKAGTLGLGAEMTVGITDTLNGRLGFNSYKYKTSGTEGDVRYDIDLNLQTTALLLDWHPTGGGFRVTAGYMINGNKLDMRSQASDSLTIGGTTYTADIDLRGRVNFKDAPYVGIGWGNAAKRTGFGFNAELGAMYQGSPKLRLTGSCTGTCDGFDDALERERIKAQDDLSSYKWYPQIAIGVSYTF